MALTEGPPGSRDEVGWQPQYARRALARAPTRRFLAGASAR